MVSTRASQVKSTDKSGKNPAKGENPAEKVVLVKVGKANIMCVCESSANLKSGSILVKKLNKSGSDLRYKPQEELKIRGKDILKQIEITKKGEFYTLSKQQLNKLQHASDSEEIESNDSSPSEEESSSEDPELSRKRKRKGPSKAPSKQVKTAVYKKGKVNAGITILPFTKEKLGPGTADFSVSISANNRNVHRAVYTNNQQLFKSLLKSTGKISSLFAHWSPDCLLTPLDIAISENKEYFIREIFKEIKNNTLRKVVDSRSSLKSIGTGGVSVQAYGVRTRAVQMSRGGREGNNAFLFEEVGIEDVYSKSLIQAIRNSSPATINLLCTLSPNFENALGSMIGSIVRSGNLELSRHLIQIAVKKLGFGFNFLHEEVLKKGNLSPFKKVSITKKPIENFLVAPLHVACINPDTKHLEALIAQCEDLGYPDLEGRRVVHYASACTSAKPLELLIKHGVNINEMDKKKITPLMIAAMYNRAEVAKVLIQKGVSAKVKSREGKSAIHYASENGCLEVLKIILPVSDINQPGGDRKTPLMYACAKGFFECAEYIIDQGARVGAKDKCKRTALIWAVKNGNSKEASLLLSKGADFNESDSSKNSPLHYAAAFGWMECIELLISAGCNVNAVNDWKMPALLIAMLKCQTGCTERLLQEPNVDINCKDEDGRTLLSQSIEVLSVDTLRQIKCFISEKNADPNIADHKGWSALHHLCNKKIPKLSNSKLSYLEKMEWKKIAWEWQEQALHLLIEGKCNLNAPTNLGLTAAMLAAKQKNWKLLKILAENNCDWSIVSGLGSAFHLMPSIDYEFNLVVYDIIKDNVKTGEVLNSFDDNGFTAFLKFIKLWNHKNEYKESLSSRLKNEEIEKINQLRKKRKLKLIDVEEDEEENVSSVEGGGSDIEEEEEVAENDDDNDAESNIEEEDNANEEEENAEEDEDNADEEEENAEEDEDNAEEDEDENEKENDEEIKEENEDEKNEVESMEEVEEDEHSAKKSNHEDQSEMQDDQKSIDPNLKLDLQVLSKLTKSRWNESKALFISILELLISKGADLSTPVNKLKKYRENNMLAKLEESPTNKNFILSLTGEKLYKEYSKEGLMSALHLLRGCASKPLIVLLTTNGININHQDFKGNTALSSFISHSASKECVGLLLEKTANPNIQNHTGATALHICAKGSKVTLTEELMKYNIDLNMQDSKGATALHIAASKRNQKLVRLLCEHGASPNIVDSKQRTALHIAFNSATVSSNTSFSVESILLNHNSDINAVDSYGRSPLHYAFIKSEKKDDLSAIDPIETVSSACSKKEINVNIQDKHLRTPLHYAARRGALTSTMFLLSKGAMVDLEDVNGNTPLGLGIIGGHLNYVSMLLQRDVDIKKCLHNIKPKAKSDKSYYNSKLKEQDYSYFRACVRLDWQGAAYLLLFAGYPYNLALQDALNEEKFDLVVTLFAKVNDTKVFQERNPEGQTLFHTLAIKGAKASKEVISDIFQQLLDYKVDFTERDIYGRTALHYAAQKHNTSLCRKLLENKIDANALDNEGISPIAKGVEGNLICSSLVLLKLFKKFSADFCVKVICEDHTSNIFLHALNKDCKESTLTLLLSSGISPFECDSLGRNALMIMLLNNDSLRIKSYLKAYQFDLNHQDNEGRTVLHYCVSPFPKLSYENKSVLSDLLQSGADWSIKDSHGHTVSYYASQQATGALFSVLKSFKASDNAAEIKEESDYEEPMEIDFEQDAREYSQSLDDIKKVVDNGIEPDSIGGFAEYYKVVTGFDVLMNKVEVLQGPYSAYVFYKMQLLHDTNRDVFVVFTRWGRIGESGAFQRTPFSTIHEAEKEFKSIFKNKTGNEWGANFVRQAGKYRPIKVATRREINTDHIKDFEYKSAPSSDLPKELESLMIVLSNNTIYRQSLQNCRLDQENINFSSISRESIEEAKDLLLQISLSVDKLEKAKTTDVGLELKEKICELSSRYYELIPRQGRMSYAIRPFCNQYEVANEKEMLETLVNIAIASKIILGALKQQKIVHPAQYIYQRLSASLKLIDRLTPEFKFLKQYFDSGNSTGCKVMNIFSIKRKGEKKRIALHNGLKNRKLLWHGTCVSNIIGILKQGLMINPIGVNIHGKALGNGLYFSDVSGKSLNYASSFTIEGNLFLFLFEVVLGNTNSKVSYGFNESNLQKKFNSIKMVGKMGPNPQKSIFMQNGIEIPVGELVLNNKVDQNWANESEYVVFKESQVRMRYLVQVVEKE